MENSPNLLTPASDFNVKVGAKFANLIFNSEQWVNRIVERIEFMPEGFTRRHISIDFNVSDEMVENKRVPILIMVKKELRSFDLTSSNGELLNMLTRKENVKLGIEILLSGVRESERNAETIDIIYKIVTTEQFDSKYTYDLWRRYLTTLEKGRFIHPSND